VLTTIAGNYTNLSARVAELERTIAELKWRLDRMEEDTGLRTRWGVRYSRRMAILANLMLGLWNFWGIFSNLLKKRRRKIMTAMFVTPTHKVNGSLNEVLYEAMRSASLRSSVFFICCFLEFLKTVF